MKRILARMDFLGHSPWRSSIPALFSPLQGRGQQGLVSAGVASSGLGGVLALGAGNPLALPGKGKYRWD